MRNYSNCSRTSYRILVKLHIKKRKLSANIIFLELHAQPWTVAASPMPDFYLNRQLSETALIFVHFKVAAVSLIKGDITFWEFSAHLSVRRKRSKLQNTLNIILLIIPNQERNIRNNTLWIQRLLLQLTIMDLWKFIPNFNVQLKARKITQSVSVDYTDPDTRSITF